MSQKKSNIPIVASLEHSGAVRSVAFHPTANLMATAGDDSVVKLWDTTDTRQPIATLVGHTAPVSCVAFHPTAPVLISGSDDKTLNVWHTTTHQCLSTTKDAHKYGVTCIAIHPTMSFIVTCGSKFMRDYIKLWQLSPDNAKLILQNKLSSESTTASTYLAVHSTDPLFVSGGASGSMDDSSSKLWEYIPSPRMSSATYAGNIETGFAKHRGSISSIALHPTKDLIATGGVDNDIMLWKINKNSQGNLVVHFTEHLQNPHLARVTGLAFHPTAPVLVSCSADESVKMWKLPYDREPVQCMGTLLGQRGPVTSLALHPNGRFFVTGNERNAALLWDCSVLNIRKQREMAVMRSGITTNLLDNFFGRRTPQTQGLLDYKSNQRGPNLLTPQEMAASLIARRINSQRRRSAIVAPIRTISPIVAAPPRDISRRARSASPPRGRSLSYTRSQRARSASPSHARLGGSSMTHRRKNRHSTKTRRYRSQN